MLAQTEDCHNLWGIIYFPADADAVGGAANGTYPLAVFGHGLGGGLILDAMYSNDLAAVAAYGFVVVAPQSCPLLNCGARFGDDLLATVSACAAHGAALHPAH